MNSEDLEYRLTQLSNDVGKYSPKDACPWPIAATFNALLNAAKELSPGDPVLDTYEPLTEGPNGVYAKNIDCGSVRTMAVQVAATL